MTSYSEISRLIEGYYTLLIRWVGKIPWKRSWQPTPVFLPGESHGQRRLVGSVDRVTKSQTRLKQLSITRVCTYPFNPLWEWFQRAKVAPLTDSQKSIIAILIALHLKSSLCCLVWTVYHHDDSFLKLLCLYETLAAYFCICLAAPKRSLNKQPFDPYLME